MVRRAIIFSAALSLFALYVAMPAQAQNPLDKVFGGRKPPISIPGLNGDPKNALTPILAEAFGLKSPFVLDQSTAFEEATAPDDFKPTPLTLISDLNRILPPGDYSVTVMFYCTQWSIHRPGRGVPYKIGRAKGRLAKQMSALLLRGTILHISPAVLNADAWRIQAGVPLSQWSDQDKALVHQLIPEYEKDLEGDWLQRIESDYNKSLRLVSRKSFDDMLRTMGDLGKLALNTKRARQTLADKTLAAERLPNMLYEQTGEGGDPQLPDDADHPSPWIQIQPGVIARFTVIEGHLGKNLLEFRITPEAAKKADDPSIQPGTGLGEDPTMLDIINGTGKDEGTSLVCYPKGKPAQDPCIEPSLSDLPPLTQECADAETPVLGDVVVYRNGAVKHTAVVTEIGADGTVTRVASKWGDAGIYSHHPSAVPDVYGQWEVYHTNRGSNALTVKKEAEAGIPGSLIYETDLKPMPSEITTEPHRMGPLYDDKADISTNMKMSYDELIDRKILIPIEPLPTGLYNCHGFTFGSRKAWITDTKVPMILKDNGYCRVKALRCKIKQLTDRRTQ